MDQVLFSSSLFKIGRFIISPIEDDFYQKDLICQPTIVFPKNSIWIEYENKPAFVADTSIINFYNHQQVYSRRAIHPKGDDCHWIKLSNELLLELLPEKGNNDFTDLFFHQNLPCEKNVFLQQVMLLKLISSNLEGEQLLIEETVLDLVQQLLQHQLSNSLTPSQTNNKHLKLVENVKSTILEDLSNNLSLKQLALINHTSAFHLSRVFKQVCGYGLSKYRTQQRLRNVLMKMQKGESDLAMLALNYGFSSHSHLTSSFKSYFNKTPSQMLSLSK